MLLVYTFMLFVTPGSLRSFGSTLGVHIDIWIGFESVESYSFRCTLGLKDMMFVCCVWPCRALVNPLPCALLCCSGMFADNTSVYMIEPLQLVHDEVSLPRRFPRDGRLF